MIAPDDMQTWLELLKRCCDWLKAFLGLLLVAWKLIDHMKSRKSRKNAGK